MKTIYDELSEARHAIDGRMDCRTPEYIAFDHLERAVRMIVDELIMVRRAALAKAQEEKS